MSLAERLRRLDDAVVGQPSPDAPVAPMWARLAAVGMGTWTLLLVYVVEYRTIGWVIAALVYGAVEVSAYVAAMRWWHRNSSGALRRRRTLFAAFPLVVGVVIVVAAALAPAPWARSQQHYARGCHPAPTSVVAKITHSVHGDFHVQRAVVYGSGSAAAATAVVSGTLTVGGLRLPLDRQPADYALVPGPFAAVNDLARRISPQVPSIFAGGSPLGSPYDQLSNDRIAAENCAAS